MGSTAKPLRTGAYADTGRGAGTVPPKSRSATEPAFIATVCDRRDADIEEVAPIEAISAEVWPRV